jgi:uncharacterized protein VirK/YbjX
MNIYLDIYGISRKLYPIKTPKDLIRRVRFIKRASQFKQDLAHFSEQISAIGYPVILNQKPHVFGTVEWPYMHNQWSVPKRLQSILTHYQLIKSLPKFLDVSDEQPKKILDLNVHVSGLSVVIDRAEWFRREGEVVLNLFKDNLRVESIAFTFAKENDELVLYVGAIQGIHANEDSLSINKLLTKSLEGMRPRSFAVELVKMIASKVGAKRIYAISDEHRHHRHAYFGNRHKDTLKSQYNLVWEAHGGELLANGFYSIPADTKRKDIAEVPSNKRAMYRRRYTMLDSIEQLIAKLQCIVYVGLLNMLTSWFPVEEAALILC